MKKFWLNALNYYYDHYVLVTLAIMTIFLGFSSYWFPLIFVSIFILVPYIFLSELEEDFYALIYMLLFATCTIFFFSAVAILGVSLIIKLIYSIMQKKVVFYKRTFFITLAICLVFSIINYGYSLTGLFQGSIYFVMPFIVFFFFTFRKIIDVKKCFKFLFIGLVSSLALSMILYVIPGGEVLNYFQGDFRFKTISEIIFLQDGNYKRLVLLTFSHNQLGNYCIYYMAFALYMLFNTRYESNKQQYLCICVSFAVAMLIGIFTMSKAFFILAIMIFAYGIFMALTKIKEKSNKVILITVLSSALIFALLNIFVLNIFNRFSNPTSDVEGTVSTLVTGRNEIWKAYFKDIFSSPLKIIFGSGIFAKDVVDIGPHNMYIGIFYRFGIVGIGALLTLAISYAYDAGLKFKLSLLKVLPIITFAVQAMAEANVDERFLFGIFAIVLLFLDKVELRRENDTEQEETDEVKYYKMLMRLKISRQKNK